MVAVARLVRGILDDGVDGRLLDDARRVAARTAELGFQAAARVGGADQSQENGRGGTDGCYGSGTTPHDASSSSARQGSRYGYIPRDGLRRDTINVYYVFFTVIFFFFYRRAIIYYV